MLFKIKHMIITRISQVYITMSFFENNLRACPSKHIKIREIQFEHNFELNSIKR
jgi:hypothetical protein